MILIGMVAVALLETFAAGAISFYAASVANPYAILADHLPRLEFLIPGIADLSIKRLITILSIGVVLVIVLKNAASAVTTYASRLFAANISGYIGEYLLKGFLDMPYEWHLQHNSADLIQGIGWRVYLGNLITAALKLLSDTLIVLILLTTLLIASPAISLLVFLTLGGTSLLIMRRVRHTMEHLATAHREYNTSINRQITQSLHGVKEVKIYNRSAAFAERYNQEVHAFARADARFAFINQVPGWLLEIIGVAMLSSSIWIMFFWFGDSTVKITGTIALLAVTSWRVLPAMSRILNNSNAIRQALPYVHGVLSYLHEIPKSESADQPHRQGFHSDLRLEKISFRYHGASRNALSGIDLTIKPGQTIGIIGTSGAGKSTLVDVIIGLLPPSSGRILLDGKEMDDPSLRAWQALIGYVPQEIVLFDTLTVKDNLEYFGRLYHLSGTRLKEKIQSALAITGLKDHHKQKVKKMSGGMKRRLNIACAILHDPKILVLDEPTVGVDPQSRNHILEAIREMNRTQKMTVLYTSHYMEEAEALCDRLMILDLGKELVQGTKTEIIRTVTNESVVEILTDYLPTGITEAFQEVPGVKKASVRDGKIHLIVDSSDPIVEKAVRLLDGLEVKVRNLSVDNPTLETVFLSITGKALRD